MTQPSATSDIVSDPVSHISISGVHGGDELDARLQRAQSDSAGPARAPRVVTLLLGAALGVGLMILLRRKQSTAG
jgi:hypothetical protein